MPRHTARAILDVAARIQAQAPLDKPHRDIAVVTLRQTLEADALMQTLDARLANLARDHPAAEREITVLRSFIAEYQHGVD